MHHWPWLISPSKNIPWWSKQSISLAALSLSNWKLLVAATYDGCQQLWGKTQIRKPLAHKSVKSSQWVDTFPQCPATKQCYSWPWPIGVFTHPHATSPQFFTTAMNSAGHKTLPFLCGSGLAVEHPPRIVWLKKLANQPPPPFFLPSFNFQSCLFETPWLGHKAFNESDFYRLIWAHLHIQTGFKLAREKI